MGGDELLLISTGIKPRKEAPLLSRGLSIGRIYLVPHTVPSSCCTRANLICGCIRFVIKPRRFFSFPDSTSSAPGVFVDRATQLLQVDALKRTVPANKIRYYVESTWYQYLRVNNFYQHEERETSSRDDSTGELADCLIYVNKIAIANESTLRLALPSRGTRKRSRLSVDHGRNWVYHREFRPDRRFRDRYYISGPSLLK